MGDPPVGKRGSTSQLDGVLDMVRTHDLRVVDADVDEQAVEFDVLLSEGVEQVVKLQAGNRQHRLAVEFRIIETVEQMDAAGARSGEAHTQAPGPLGIGAGIERRCFFVSHLDETDLVLASTQRLDDAVDAVARDAEDRVNFPFEQSFDQYVGCCGRGHETVPGCRGKAAFKQRSRVKKGKSSPV